MAEPSKEAKPIVVCVDDDADMLMSVVRTLRKEPIDVRKTLDPNEAIAWIAAHPVAVLVSDYEMPQMTGAQLTGMVKRIRPETVRILLTGKRTLDTAVDGINQGEIFRFIGKPFDADTLRKEVAAAVERNKELLALAGDRQRRQRGERMRADLELEYPGITLVELAADGHYELADDPRRDAAELGLAALTASGT